MPSIETYRKQAKLLVRWHRERNYSMRGHDNGRTTDRLHVDA
jgi:hypothetical protein